MLISLPMRRRRRRRCDVTFDFNAFFFFNGIYAALPVSAATALLSSGMFGRSFFECINAHTLLLLFLLLFLLSALLLLLLAALFFFNSWEFGNFFVTLVKGKGQVCRNNEITALYRKFSFALLLLLFLFIQCLLFIAFT